MKNFTLNWKTTLAGAITILIQVGPILFPKYITPTIANTISALAISLGLIAAKDGNVSGTGNVASAAPNIPPAK